MARINNLTNFLTDVATAIRSKKDSQASIAAEDFDTEILNLPSQGTYQGKSMNITTNGNYRIVPDSGYDAMTSVDIGVNVVDSEYATNLALTNQILGPVVLPYTPLEYLQATGTQYINLGIIPNQNTEAEVKFKLNSKPANDKYLSILGSATTTQKNFRYFVASGSKWAYQDGTLQNLSLSDSDTDLHVVKFGKGKVIDNGIQVASGTRNSYTGLEIYLFASNINVPADNPQWLNYNVTFNIYHCKIWQNGVLTQDLIPVKDTNDFPCMYDKVSETYFYNIGTGSFVPGPVKS